MAKRNMTYFSVFVKEVETIEGIESITLSHLEDKHFTILEDNKAIRLDYDVEVSIRYASMPRKIMTIKKGYVFDGASIPPVFWDLIGEPDDTDFIEAALVHDYLYGRRYNRAVADQIFKEFLIREGVWSFKATLMWAAVRLGGHRLYAGDTSSFWNKLNKLIDGESYK